MIRDFFMRCVARCVALAPLMLMLLMCACSHTRYIPVEKVRMDSVQVLSFHRDSVLIRDSVFIRSAGDTVYIDKIRYKMHQVIRVDTLWREVERQVQVPYPVERELSWWENFCINAIWYLIVLIAVLIAMLILLAKRTKLKKDRL